MRAKCENIGDAVKSLVAGFWITFSVCSVAVHGQEGDGCGHTQLGTESGTLASQNYPGTYPSNTWCKWRLRVREGRTLRLLFGDFDVERSPGCSNGSFIITDKNGQTSLGPVCGKLDSSQKNVTLNSSEVTITFKSGPHRSGRGFLLSYATDQYPVCTALLGARTQQAMFGAALNMVTEIPPSCASLQCMLELHLTVWEATHSDLSTSFDRGSLSEKKLLFTQECKNILAVSGLNASSFGETNSQEHRRSWSSRNMDSGHEFFSWAADNNDPKPWVELELRDRSNITGIITTGSNDFYIESYILFFSKDRKNWKLYKGALSKEKKVFQAYTEGHLRVLNSLFPFMVARFIRLQPLSWHGRASAQVQVLGCPVAKVTPRSRSAVESPPIKVNMGTSRPSLSPISTEGPVLVETTKSCQSFQPKSLLCPQSELISYPVERNVHDALPSPPLNDYAEPAIGQKVGSTFRPSSDEGYTVPFIFNHYDTPGKLPEYAEPLPPEPEYATPFSEQPSESLLPTSAGVVHSNIHCTGGRSSSRVQYDCPSHRMLSNGYCTPALHVNGPRPVSVVYAKPKSFDSLLQKQTYEEPL
ncbi:hypothetical protein PAMP_002418 [Pampus punctatissimus]